MNTIAIIGAGGNAREIAGIIRDIGRFEFVGFLADCSGPHDSPRLGAFDWLHTNHVDCLAMGIGNPGVKFSVGEMLRRSHPGIEWPVLIHPTAYVGKTCELEPGAVVCVGAIVTENVSVGTFAQLNFGCTVGHEANIGAATLINPGASVSGGVRIGKRAMIGTGARILQYLSVGDDAVVGAGAVVINDVPPEATVVGIPARTIPKAASGQS